MVWLKSPDDKLYIVLFQSKKDILAETGGNLDSNDLDLEQTALRELREESSNLFRVSRLENPLRIRNYICYQACFLLDFPEFRNCYEHNSGILREVSRKNQTPKSWGPSKGMHIIEF